MKKDLIITIGGILATAAVVFGLGLFAAGTFLTTPAAVKAKEPESEAKTDGKAENHFDSKEKESSKTGETEKNSKDPKKDEQHASKAEAHGKDEHSIAASAKEEHPTTKESGKKETEKSAELAKAAEGAKSVEHSKTAAEPKMKPDEPAKNESKDEHGKASGETAESKHGGKEEKEHKDTVQSEEDIAADLSQFETDYNAQMARGNYDDARIAALKAAGLAGPKNNDWQKRLADATYLSDALPAMQRYAKAFEIYSKLIAQDSKDNEWPQYRACVTLRNMGRWPDALEAAKVYLERYPNGAHYSEIRLLNAQGLLTDHKRLEAREELQGILSGQAPPEVRAQTLIEIAQLDRERSTIEPAEAPILKAEFIDVSSTPKTESKATAPAGIPTERWKAIIEAVKDARLNDAKQLLEPWTGENSSLTKEERARINIQFAQLLRQLPVYKDTR